MPAAGRLSERISSEVFRSSAKARKSMGAFLHISQDHGRSSGYVRPLRERTGAGDRGEDGCLGRCVGSAAYGRAIRSRSCVWNTAAWRSRSSISTRSPAKPEYVTLARRFGNKKFFDPLASDHDDLPGIHANTHIPQVIGAARGYELTGDASYHEIASYFWREVVTQHTYATGGTSNGESGRSPANSRNSLAPPRKNVAAATT